MAITSTITIDASGNIVGAVSLNGSTLIDTITYTNLNQQVSFVTHLAITLSSSDFITLINFYLAFNAGIIASLISPNQHQFVPFTSVDVVQANDGISQLSFTLTSGSSLFDYTATYPAGTVNVARRNSAVTLSYAQWLYALYILANYKLFVLNAYKL